MSEAPRCLGSITLSLNPASGYILATVVDGEGSASHHRGYYAQWGEQHELPLTDAALLAVADAVAQLVPRPTTDYAAPSEEKTR